jgi:hypothetical protein
MKTTDPVVNVDEIVSQLLHRTSKEQVRSLVEAAVASSGQAVSATSFEPGDELCPTFKFPFPFPPKFESFLANAAKLGSVHVFPIGIPNPIEVVVQTRSGPIA